MFTCRFTEFKVLSKEECEPLRVVAKEWWADNSEKVKGLLNSYVSLSTILPIPDRSSTHLRKSALGILKQEAEIISKQVITTTHLDIGREWNQEILDKIYEVGKEIPNALYFMGLRESLIDKYLDSQIWYKMANDMGYVKSIVFEPICYKPKKLIQEQSWQPHMALTAECLLGAETNASEDLRWRWLWEKDRYSSFGGNRNQRMDAIIEAEKDAAALQMTEKQRAEFQWQRAKIKRNVAYTAWCLENEDAKKGYWNADRIAAAEATLKERDKELDAAWLNLITPER